MSNSEKIKPVALPIVELCSAGDSIKQKFLDRVYIGLLRRLLWARL